MYLNCINKNNTQVLSNLSELSALIGSDNAEWLLMYNNGNSLDYLPNGTVNNEFTKLLDKYDGNRALALKERAAELLNYTKEMRDIADQAIANGTFMKAPNGNPTNLNERQWLQVRTKAFKNWFGDWENDAANASKVVDENGEPLVTFRIDYEKFKIFDKSFIGTSLESYFGKGFYFTPSLDYAMMFPGTYVRAFFLNAKNVYDIKDSSDSKLKELEKSNDSVNWVKEKGKEEELVVFDPNQIKSATDNEGSFSRENNNVLFQLEDDLTNQVSSHPSYSRIKKFKDSAVKSDKHANTLKDVDTVINALLDANPKEFAAKTIYGETYLVGVNRPITYRQYENPNTGEISYDYMLERGFFLNRPEDINKDSVSNVEAVQKITDAIFEKAKEEGYIDRYKKLTYHPFSTSKGTLYKVSLDDMTDTEIEDYDRELYFKKLYESEERFEETHKWNNISESSDRNLLKKFGGNQSISVSEALDNLLRFGAKNTELIKLLKNIVGEVGNIQITLIPTHELRRQINNDSAAAYYDPFSNRIFVGSQSKFKGVQVDNTLLHEIIHAIVFNIDKTEEQAQQLINIYNRAVKMIEQRYGKPITALLDESNPDIVTIKDRTVLVRRLFYGLTSVDEFVSELFTNPLFAYEINKVDKFNEEAKEESYSLFEEFVQWIVNAFKRISTLKNNSQLFVDASKAINDLLINNAGSVISSVDNRIGLSGYTRIVSNIEASEPTLANTIDTIQNEKQAKTLKELAPELYEKALSIQALNNLPGMTPAIINDVAKYFTEQLISVVEAIIEGDENNFTYSYLLESFPNTFTKEVLSELIEIRKLPNQIDKYRSTFKLINTKLLFDVVLADIDTYAADTFPEMKSLWIDDGVKQIFRIAYIDYINKFLFDYFGFRITTKLSKTGKTEYGIDKAFEQKQDNTHDTAEDDYLDEMENSGEQEREFDFLTSNLNKLLSDTIDLKVKNLITRIPQPDKFDRFGLPIYYPRAYVMNTLAQLFSKCLTFEDMLDEIKNIDNEIMPFKDDIIDMMLDEKNRTLFYRSFQKAKQNYWKIINNKHNQFIDSKLDSNSKKDVIEEQIINAAEKAGTENAKSSMYVYTDENKISSTIKFNADKVKELRNKVVALAKKYDFKLKNNSYYKTGKLNTNTDASTYQSLINEISGLFSDMNLWRISEYELKQLFRPDKNGDVKWNNFAELLDNILKYANYKKNPLSSESLSKFENLKSFISDKLYGITEAVEYDSGKPYATITYTHYLKQLEKRIKKTRVNTELYNKFIQEEYLNFRYFGKYYNEPWFKSWIKDGLDLFEVKTLTTFNGKQYDKMVKDTDHFEFGFINFIKAFNKHTNYVLPVLSDKTTNGMIVGSVFEKDEVVDRLFSVFMQELDRIKQVYHRACIRYSDPSVIRIKNWDTGPLMKDGSTLKLQFNHKIGGGEFKLMSMINPVLYKINDENLDKNSFEYKLQQYIYNEDSLEIKDLMDKDSTFFSSLYNDFYKYCDNKLEEMSTEFANDFISKDGKYYDYFKKHFPANKVLSTIRDLKKEGDSENEKVANLIKLFFINNFYAKTQIFQLLVGDIAVYDGWNDAQKRIAGCISPSLRYDLGAKSPINSDTKTDSYYSTTGKKRALVISDTEGRSNQYNVIEKIFERRRKIASDNFAKAHKKKLNELSKEEQKQLQEELGRINAEFKLFSETNGTDGQGFLSLEGLRKHLGMLGYAPGFLDDFIKDVRKMLYITNRDQQRIAWEKIKEDYPNALFEIEKQFTFSPTPYTDLCDDNSVVKLCTMVKNAEMPILDFDEMLYRNDKNPSNNPLLLTLLKFMDSHDIDVIYTKSNIKSGLKGVVDLSKCKTVKSVRETLEKAISDENINEYVIEIPYQNIGEQQPGIKHYIDSDIILGAQVKKLMPSFIKRCFNKKTVKINEKNYTGDDFLKLFEKVIAGLNRKGFYDLKKYFKLPKGVMDKLTAGIDLTDEEALKARIGFCKFVQEELEKDPQVDSEIINDLSLTPSGEWKLPLEDMSGMLKLQKIFTKLVKTTAVKNKIDGGYLVQATDAMRLNIINDENPDNKDVTGNKNLKIIFYDKLKDGTVVETAFPENPIGIAYLEARLPYFYKKFYSRYKDSSKIPDNLRKLICYRTPTEGACSIFPVKVVGFSPKASGGKIQLPMDITSIAGVDFDIDKLFFTAPAMDKDGNYVNYNLDKDISTMSKKELENLLLDIMWKVCTSENYMYEMFSPSNFILLKRLANIFKVFNGNDETERTPDLLRELFDSSDDELSAKAKAIDNNAQLCDFRTEMYIHQRNARSAGEIGPFAINNVIHSLLEGLGITVDNVFTPVNFCGVQLSNSTIIDPMYDNNGNLTTRNNQMFLAAAVDGSKSPVLDDLGLTPEAINVITVMTRLGISVPDCILFIQQPIIRNFFDTFAEKMDAWEFDPKSGTKRPSMSDTLKEYIDDINVLFKGKLPLSTSVITHDNLIDGTVVDLSTGEAEEWAKQTPLLGVLNGFIKCNELFLRAQKILRADSVTGTNDLKTLFDFMIFLSNTEKMTTYKPTKKPAFSKKFAVLFNTKSNTALYNIADQRDQLKETINLILSVSAPLVRQFYEESSMHILSETDKEFTGEDLMQMYCEFIWFVMLNSSENRVFNNSYDFLSYFATDARTDITKLQKELSSDPEFSENLIVKHLYYNKFTEVLSIRSLGMSSDVRKQVSQDWLKLLSSDNKAAKDFGEILLNYSFYTTAGSQLKGNLNNFITSDMKLMIPNYKNALKNLSISKLSFSIFSDLYFRNHKEKATDLSDISDDITFISEPLIGKSGSKLKTEEGDDVFESILITPDNKKRELPKFGTFNGLLYKSSADDPLIYELIEPLGGAISEYSVYNLENGSVIGSNKIGYLDPDAKMSDNLSLEELRELQEIETSNTETVEQESEVDDSDLIFTDEEADDNLFLEEIPEDVKREAAKKIKDENPCTNTL